MRWMLVLLLLIAVGCQPTTTELSDARRAEIVAVVDSLNAEYWEAWRAADWDRGMTYYYDSPEFVWASAGAVFFGVNTLQEARPGFDHVASQTFTFRDSRTIVMAPDAATVTARGTWSQTDAAGVTGAPRPFAWTAVWLLRDGEWKMHLVHMSNPVRGPDAM